MPTLTDETVSTVSRLTRDLEEAVRQFHQARLGDDYACLLLDGVSLRVQRPLGPNQVQMLVAHGMRRVGSRTCCLFCADSAKTKWKGCCRIFTGADWKAERWA